MFTLPKTDFSRYFHVYSNHVTEAFGTHFPDNGPNYQPYEDASDLDFAIAQAVDFREKVIDGNIAYLDSVLGHGRWFTYWVKSLWNADTKKLLAEHYTKLRTLKAFSMGHNENDVEVNLLPDMLEFKGEILPIGTLIYMVDEHSLTIRSSAITGCKLKVYHKKPAIALVNFLNFLIYSDSFKDGIAKIGNVTYFLDLEKANTVLKDAIKKSMAELVDQAKQLGE